VCATPAPWQRAPAIAGSAMSNTARHTRTSSNHGHQHPREDGTPPGPHAPLQTTSTARMAALERIGARDPAALPSTTIQESARNASRRAKPRTLLMTKYRFRKSQAYRTRDLNCVAGPTRGRSTRGASADRRSPAIPRLGARWPPREDPPPTIPPASDRHAILAAGAGVFAGRSGVLAHIEYGADRIPRTRIGPAF